MIQSLLRIVRSVANCGVPRKMGVGLLAGALLFSIIRAKAHPGPPVLAITFDNPSSVAANGSATNELGFTIVNTGSAAAMALSTFVSFTSGNDSMAVTSPSVVVTGGATVLGDYSGGGTAYLLGGNNTLVGYIVYSVPLVESGGDGVNTVTLTGFGSSVYSNPGSGYVLDSSSAYSQTVSRAIDVTVTAANVPEPGSLALLSIGALALRCRGKLRPL